MLDVTISVRRVAILAAALAATVGALAAVAQVETNVPDIVAEARPASVERITIHGKALEGISGYRGPSPVQVADHRDVVMSL
jgi:hypothetical protein